MPDQPRILAIAVPCPLYRRFDYLSPTGADSLPRPGMRVRVPFGRIDKIGVVLAISDRSELDAGRLRPAHELLDETPLLGEELLRLGAWIAEYYRQPIGETMALLLPAALRRGERPTAAAEAGWRATTVAMHSDLRLLDRAPSQRRLVELLKSSPRGLSATELNRLQQGWRRPMRELAAKGLVREAPKPCLPTHSGEPRTAPPPLTDEQQACVSELLGHAPGFRVSMIEGITGSGKTEVYLAAIREQLTAGRQVLMLVPEIGLTPQLVARLRARTGARLAVIHSALTDRERLCAWHSARQGDADLILGTRSAVFTPMARPGLIVIDEEHDASFKQQDGVRYHARDVAVMRAKMLGLPVILGSATPSLETLRNCEDGRYRHLRLSRRPGEARPPALSVLDVRNRPLTGGLSDLLLERVDTHLDNGGQVLLFLNRRGYAPVLFCHDCGWTAHCRRCDAMMTMHRARSALRCHHCGASQRVPQRCPACGSESLVAVGQGTERIEEVLQERYGEQAVLRIDRDTTRRKGSLEERLDLARRGEGRILVGTQLLAKGHDFPGITLVGIVDADSGLFAVDLRATEHLAQQIVQVTGRAGRGPRPGEALVQTHFPDHPLLQTLVSGGYPAFARATLAERREAAMPPYASHALFRAEAVQPEPPHRFLDEVRRLLDQGGSQEVTLLGPMPAPMERRAGRFRAQLLMQAPTRRALQRTLEGRLDLVSSLPSARAVRWSLDVDPLELY